MTTNLNHIRLTVGEEHVSVEHYTDLETDATHFVTAEDRTELLRVNFTADQEFSEVEAWVSTPRRYHKPLPKRKRSRIWAFIPLLISIGIAYVLIFKPF